jgi:hypothetical protein
MKKLLLTLGLLLPFGLKAAFIPYGALNTNQFSIGANSSISINQTNIVFTNIVAGQINVQGTNSQQASYVDAQNIIPGPYGGDHFGEEYLGHFNSIIVNGGLVKEARIGDSMSVNNSPGVTNWNNCIDNLFMQTMHHRPLIQSNAAISGENVVFFSTNVVSTNVAAFHPDVMIINLGQNDAQDAPQWPTNFGPSSIIFSNALVSFITYQQSINSYTNCSYVLESPSAAYSTNATPAFQRNNQWNILVDEIDRQVARQLHCTFISVFAMLHDPLTPFLDSFGVHPSDAMMINWNKIEMEVLYPKSTADYDSNPLYPYGIPPYVSSPTNYNTGVSYERTLNAPFFNGGNVNFNDNNGTILQLNYPYTQQIFATLGYRVGSVGFGWVDNAGAPFMVPRMGTNNLINLGGKASDTIGSDIVGVEVQNSATLTNGWLDGLSAMGYHRFWILVNNGWIDGADEGTNLWMLNFPVLSTGGTISNGVSTYAPGYEAQDSTGNYAYRDQISTNLQSGTVKNHYILQGGLAGGAWKDYEDDTSTNVNFNVPVTVNGAQITGTNVFYASHFTTNMNGNFVTRSGTDNSAALQAMFNLHPAGANWPVTFIIDGIAAVANTLVVHGNNVTVVGAYSGAGFILSSNANTYLFVNDLNGNNFVQTNLTISNLIFNGNRFGNLKSLTNNSPYYPPVNSLGFDWNTFVWFSGVNGLNINNCSFNEAPNFALTIGGYASNVTLDTLNFFWDWSLGVPLSATAPGENADTIHIWGNATNIYIHNITTDGGDDRLALNGDELSVSNGGWTERGTNQGFIYNLTLDGMHCWGYPSNILNQFYFDPFLGAINESSYGGVRFLSYSTNYNHWHNITLKNIDGLISRKLYSIIGAENLAPGGPFYTYVDNLQIANVNCYAYGSYLNTMDLELLNGENLSINNFVTDTYPDTNVAAGVSYSYIHTSGGFTNTSIQNVFISPPTTISNLTLYKADSVLAANNVSIGNTFLGGSSNQWNSLVGLSTNGGTLQLSAMTMPNVTNSASAISGQSHSFVKVFDTISVDSSGNPLGFVTNGGSYSFGATTVSSLTDSSGNTVTVNGTQTITGAKTFGDGTTSKLVLINGVNGNATGAGIALQEGSVYDSAWGNEGLLSGVGTSTNTLFNTYRGNQKYNIPTGQQYVWEINLSPIATLDANGLHAAIPVTSLTGGFTGIIPVFTNTVDTHGYNLCITNGAVLAVPIF